MLSNCELKNNHKEKQNQTEMRDLQREGPASQREAAQDGEGGQDRISFLKQHLQLLEGVLTPPLWPFQ